MTLFGIFLLVPISNQDSRGASIWTDKGCGSTYAVYDPVTVYFVTYPGVEFEIWSYHSGLAPKLVSAGVGTGQTFYVTGTIGPPAGEITFVLSMPCTEGCYYCGMCDYGQCTIYVIEVQCTCSNQCFGNDLWAMKCVNGVCVQDYLIEKNSTQCGYDPCRNVSCGTVCRGYNLWSQKCVNGTCVDDRLLETNSVSCGYDPCTNIVCRNTCKGYSLWSQKCVNGACVDDALLEANSVSCGFDPCQDHCTNGEKDCGEYGVDCGGGCPFTDSDGDGVEDCKDLCPNSQCNKVDSNGCEIDADGDGVTDCVDQCPNEAGDPSNGGCPTFNFNYIILAGIGGIIIIAGGLIFWGLKGKGPPSPPSPPTTEQLVYRPTPEDIAARREIAEQIAKETAEKVAKEKVSMKIGEEATTKIGTKIGEEASTKIGTKIGEEASTKIGTKIGEEATMKIGTKIGEEASTKIGTTMAGEASAGLGTEAAESAAGAGVTGMVARKKEMHCPNCGEKLPPDSKFCSKCGHKL